MVSPSADLYRIPLTFEKGLFEGQEKSVLPPGYTSLQENWISEPTGGLRCRRGWLSTPTAGLPSTRNCRGIGNYVSADAYATPSTTPVQSKTATGSAVSTLAATAFDNPTTLGNLLVFAVQWSNPGTRTVSTPPPGYTLVGAVVVGTGVSDALYIKANCGANESAPSITLSGGAYIKVITAEYANITATSPVDQNGNNTGLSAAPSTASLTTTQTKELLLAAFGTDFGGTLGVSTLTTGTGNGTAPTTASITPGAGNLILVWVVSGGTGTHVAPTLSGNGLTWAQVATKVDPGTGDRITLFRAMGSAPTSGVVTMDFAGNSQGRVVWAVNSVTGTAGTSANNGSDAIVQSPQGNGTGTSGSVTLAAPAASTNRAMFGNTHAANEVTTPRASWTEQDDVQNGATTLETQYRSDAFETTASATWATSSDWAGIAIELAISTASPSLSAPTNSFSVVQNIAGDANSGAFALTARVVAATGSYSTAMTSTPQNWATKHVTFKATQAPTTTGYYLVAYNDQAGGQYGIYSIDRSLLAAGPWALVENLAIANPTQLVAFTMGLGSSFYVASNFSTVRRWDGATVSAVAGSPAGRCIAFHKNRLFVGGTTTNPTRLWYSDVGSYSSWPGASYIDVGQDDGEAIEDIAPFQNGLVIAKQTSLFFLSGAGPDSFILQRLNVGGSAPGRTIMPTPYGCVVAGKTAVWLIGNGGAVDLISKPIENTYAVTGAFITCSFIHETVYICDEGSGTTWAWHAPSGAWRQEKVSVAAEAPAVIFNQDDRQLLGPRAATVGSLLSYRLHPSGARGRDAGIGETFKANTAELWVGEADRPVTPTHLWLRVRQRGGDATETPSADLVVTPVYDGVAKAAVRLLPQNGAPKTFTKRLDVGSTKGVRSVEFQVQKVHTSAQSSLMDIEGAALYCIVEKAK